MRSPTRDLAATSVELDPLPSLGVIVMNRMAFGPRPGDLSRFESLGSTDRERLEKYVEQQLYPEKISDTNRENRLIEAGFTTLNKSRAQLWADHVDNPRGDRYLPLWETERATIGRAIYSERQLLEVLADFWHNHFNINAYDYWISPLWVHQDRDIIRANIFGNFRKMVEDVGTSFPMLIYLDNVSNTRAGPNENYARELFELHTLGAENYYGTRSVDDVPLDEHGVPIAYVDEDVYEAARAFTGWSADYDTGLFQYNHDEHDRFRKEVMRKRWSADQAYQKEGREIYDLLAAHPGTGRYIARKLCRRLIADDPPQRIVDEAAAVFTAQRDAPDQLRQVYRTILLSPEFANTWGQKVKRPLEFFASSMRAVGADLPLKMGDRYADWFVSFLRETSHVLFQWPTPDGYPDYRARWLSTNPMVVNWRIANGMVDVNNYNWTKTPFKLFDPFVQMPSDVRSPRKMVDFWIAHILGFALPETARQDLIDFTARGRDPEFDINLDEEISRERLWGMIGLLLMSPQHLLR
jgi:uncharacterized protein (DUF1800 family)